MTTDTLLNALENCLQALEQGADVESCLVRYPALADELRPILIASVQARAASVIEVPVDVVRRGKARFLQAAAEMREQQVAAPARSLLRKKGFPGARFFRLAVTTVLVIVFLLTGWTGLVNASSGALPGDSLYPVKRSLEGVQLVFVFDKHAKEELEHKFDHKRLQEIEKLYSEKRFEQVNFEGIVQSQQKSIWVIDGLNIAIEDETTYTGEIALGSTVQIIGETDDGLIKAEQIILIATPGVTPTAISTSTPVPQTLQTITPGVEENLEGLQTPEAGEDSGNNGSSEMESPKPSESSEKPGTQNENNNETDSNSIETPHPGNENDSNSIETPRPGGDDSGSKDGESDGNNKHPSTDNSETGGGDNSQPTPDGSGEGDD